MIFPNALPKKKYLINYFTTFEIYLLMQWYPIWIFLRQAPICREGCILTNKKIPVKHPVLLYNLLPHRNQIYQPLKVLHNKLLRLLSCHQSGIFWFHNVDPVRQLLAVTQCNPRRKMKELRFYWSNCTSANESIFILNKNYKIDFCNPTRDISVAT